MIFKFKSKNQNKIFCIGRNKTGTTSLSEYFRRLNFKVASQTEGEKLFYSWLKGDYNQIIKFIKKSKKDVFQDIPFSLPGTYQIIDKSFPNSKFILTIRNNPDQWYQSLINFHSKLFGNGNIPTAKDLKNSNYLHKGWVWQTNQGIYNTPHDDPYNETILKEHYVNHNKNIINYFSTFTEKLLIVNIAENEVSEKIASFLNLKKNIPMPWKNKT